MILPATVAENIAYGRPDATEAQIREAAELAGAGRFIEELPDGYQTQVAEGGQNLSGGQRIAIARALLTEAPFIVFDEPTSALDPELTGEILKVMRALAAEKMTMVVVTHEMGFAREVADRAMLMDAGVVVEEGPARELIDNPRNERTRAFLRRFSERG